MPIALGGQYDIQSLNVVDWNHDGLPDLVVGAASNENQYSDPQTYQYFVLLNEGQGNFTNAPNTPIPVSYPNAYYHISPLTATGVYDLAGDGQYDIVHLGALIDGAGGLNGSADFDLEVIGKDQFVGYSPQMELPLGLDSGPTVYPQEITFADLNGDGKPDIITGDTGYYADAAEFQRIAEHTNRLRHRRRDLRHDGPQRQWHRGEQSDALGIGNFSGTGHHDVACLFGGDIEIFENDGKGNFTEQCRFICRMRRTLPLSSI